LTSIAIIGAGLSGLTAAKILEGYANITIFEKSRGVSGRMSTRRSEAYSFDHGAQYFKVKSDEFKEFITPMILDGTIKTWDARLVEFKNRQLTERQKWKQSDPYYVGVPGMNSIAKHLAKDLSVCLNVCVKTLKKNNNKWKLKDDSDKLLGEYDWVISTIPPEQALKVLPESIPFVEKISDFKMKSCFALMLGFKKILPLEFDAAVVHGEDISWISVDSSKPGRNKNFSLLVHSTNQWADEHFEDNREQLIELLRNQTSKVINCDLSNATHQVIHGWRYANIEKRSGETHYLDNNQNIAVCGDWFIQGRVESAFISGFEMATNLLNSLNLGEKNGK